MNRSELRSQLERAAAKDDPAGDRGLLAKARPVLNAPWLDVSLRNALKRLAARRDETIALAPLRPLDAGETWVLLAERPGVGDVVRAKVCAGQPESAPRAQREVARAVKGLAAAVTAAERMLPSEWFGAALEVSCDPHLEIVGDSLGLAASVGIISGATQVRPRDDTAGTAAVDPSGRLLPIEYLVEKCEALRRLWPHVTRVVVADSQVVPAVDGLEFVRAGAVLDAMPEFGLDLRAVQPRKAGDLKTRLTAIEHEEERPHASSRWVSLSAETWEIGQALFALKDQEAGRAILMSALLASHAGDNTLAIERLVGLADTALRSASLRARKAIYLASFTIDVDAAHAAVLARSAVSLTEALQDEGDQALLVGRALGTLGRALMAAGQYAEAEHLLRRALEHHQAHADGEVARSICYLACCLRMMGRAEDALQAADLALVVAAKNLVNYEVAETSERYALLERGRALLALGRHDEAVDDLQRVLGPGKPEAAYPGLGARRSLVTALRRLGRPDAARDMLQMCVWVARGNAPLTLRRVAAVAVAEELGCAGPPSLAPDALASAWTACFGAADPSVIIRTWMY